MITLTGTRQLPLHSLPSPNVLSSGERSHTTPIYREQMRVFIYNNIPNPIQIKATLIKVTPNDRG